RALDGRQHDLVVHRLPTWRQRSGQGVRRPDDAGQLLDVELAHDLADGQRALHAGLTMAGPGAPVVEGARRVGTEHDRHAAALAVDDAAVRSRELLDEDVVCDVVTVDQGDLHDLPWLSGQVRVG